MTPLQKEILRINAEQSARYVADESARLRYWAKHPTFFACVKCMDGRVLFPTMTQTPIGVVKPFRAIGGKFEVWWPSFLGRLRSWVETAVHQGSLSCLFVTYHFSASDPHLGCAGWGYETAAAKAHAFHLAADLAQIFGDQLTTIVAGVETDQDEMTLHGPQGDVASKELIGLSEEEVLAILHRAFPAMPRVVAQDLTPFLLGNAARVLELQQSPRKLGEKEHNERIIAIGQGFDWLAQANLALIINDADPNLAESIRVAASLIEKNLARASETEEAMILTSIPYTDPGIDYQQAVARAEGLKGFAEHVIHASHAKVMDSGRLHSLATVMWEPSKKIEAVGRKS